MIKQIIKDGYIIEFPDTTKYTKKEIEKIIEDSLALIKRKDSISNKEKEEDIEIIYPEE